MERIIGEVLTFINQMQPRHWLFVLAGLIVIGFACMKSVGARAHY